MHLSWDLDAGAVYISLGDGEIACTVEADGNTQVDLDARGHVLGVEVIAFAYPSALEAVTGWPGFPAGEMPMLRAYFGEPADVRGSVPVMEVAAGPVPQ